jgi:transketolase
MGWERWVGDQGTVIGLERFGASAPYKTIYEHLGFTTDNVVLKALQTIDNSKKSRP